MNLLYSVGDTRNKIREIQANAKNGLLSGLINNSTQDIVYMMSAKMMESILQKISVKNRIEYDEKLKVYTIYNDIVPHFYGEGESVEIATNNMVAAAIEFSKEYEENMEIFSGIFEGVQQFLISNILLNINNEKKIREILNIG